jgi:adenosylcobinamide-phosphate synthase
VGEAAGLVATVGLALALDLALGDPPNRWHPVAWIGSALGRGRRLLQRGGPPSLLLRGAALTLAVAALAGVAGWAVSAVAALAGPPAAIAEALALKSLISLRDLMAATSAVGDALAGGRLPAARQLVGHHLVSRPTDRLDEGGVASAAIESVAENLTDAVVAPILFYVLFGLAGAAVYRAVNTADAMIGYRDGALEWFGKTAARLDDALNLIPARIAGPAVALGAALAGGDARAAWSTMRAQHGVTSSPNAGWTMAAMAGALGVTLEKAGAYALGAGPRPGPGDVGRSVGIVRMAALVSLGFLIAAVTAARLAVG